MIKFIFFTALVLWLGQITVQNETIGSRFSRQVNQVLSWTGKELAQTNIIKAMPTLPKWLKKAQQGETSLSPRKESITASDRESILHLLE